MHVAYNHTKDSRVRVDEYSCEQVLRQVYPVDASNVDDELVQSIEFPARDPNAPEVFYRLAESVCMMHSIAIVHTASYARSDHRILATG